MAALRASFVPDLLQWESVIISGNLEAIFDGFTLLMVAAKEGDFNLVKTVLDAGAQVLVRVAEMFELFGGFT